MFGCNALSPSGPGAGSAAAPTGRGAPPPRNIASEDVPAALPRAIGAYFGQDPVEDWVQWWLRWMRDAHLRTADFLDVERYPTITFKSSAIVQESQHRFKLIGNLTFHGVTREVVLDTSVNGVVKSPFGTEVMGITAETTINRQDFGMTFNMPLETGGWALGNSVKIEAEIQAVKEAHSLRAHITHHVISGTLCDVSPGAPESRRMYCSI